jgi:hypothetical protein
VTFQTPICNGCSQDAAPTQEWGGVTGIIVVTIQPPNGDRHLDVLKRYCIRELGEVVGYEEQPLGCYLCVSVGSDDKSKKQD